MLEIPEVYFECFSANVHATGIVTNLLLFPSKPNQQNTAVATVRCSLPAMKEFVFIMRRIIKETEEKSGNVNGISSQRLQELKTAKEDWDSFWK